MHTHTQFQCPRTAPQYAYVTFRYPLLSVINNITIEIMACTNVSPTLPSTLRHLLPRTNSHLDGLGGV